MTPKSCTRSTWRWLAAGTGLVAGAYGGYAAVAWSRYGRVPQARPDEADAFLDHFIPVYDIVERHHIRVAAPAAVTLAAAKDQDLFGSPIARAIFRTREVVMGATADRDNPPRPRGLLAQVEALGWGM